MIKLLAPLNIGGVIIETGEVTVVDVEFAKKLIENGKAIIWPQVEEPPGQEPQAEELPEGETSEEEQHREEPQAEEPTKKTRSKKAGE